MKQVKLFALLLVLCGIVNGLQGREALMCQSIDEAQAGVVVVQFSGCLRDADFEEAMKEMLRSAAVKDWICYYPEVAITVAGRSVDDIEVAIFMREWVADQFERIDADSEKKPFYRSLANAIANHLATQGRVVKEVQLYIDNAAHN